MLGQEIIAEHILLFCYDGLVYRRKERVFCRVLHHLLDEIVFANKLYIYNLAIPLNEFVIGIHETAVRLNAQLVVALQYLLEHLLVLRDEEVILGP